MTGETEPPDGPAGSRPAPAVGAAFRGRPWAYPGRPVPRPALLGGGEGGRGLVPLRLEAGAAVEDALLAADGAAAGRGDRRLSDDLAARGAASLSERVVVAAYGSNADPAVLAAKLADDRTVPGATATSGPVPLVPAVVGGARLAASAHVSAPGCLPAAAAAAPGARLPVVLLWLDAQQVRRLDATEPNYSPLALDPAVHPVVLPGGRTPPRGVTVHEARWGVLPLAVPCGGQVALWRAVLSAMPAVRALLGVDPGGPAARVRAALLRLGDDAALREAVGVALRPAAGPTGLAARPRPADAGT